MKTLDINSLKQDLSVDPDPYKFNLYLSVESKKLIVEGNPFVKSKEFLSTLLGHFEETQNFDACIDLRKRLDQLN